VNKKPKTPKPFAVLAADEGTPEAFIRYALEAEKSREAGGPGFTMTTRVWVQIITWIKELQEERQK
jgi:hypothetical protein